jgi:pyrophosphate--fructose-6-phosphate 1-phosphotransferase
MQVILGEEVAQSKLTLFEISRKISDVVQARAEQGFNFRNFIFPVFKFIFMIF